MGSADALHTQTHTPLVQRMQQPGVGLDRQFGHAKLAVTPRIQSENASYVQNMYLHTLTVAKLAIKASFSMKK